MYGCSSSGINLSTRWFSPLPSPLSPLFPLALLLGISDPFDICQLSPLPPHKHTRTHTHTRTQHHEEIQQQETRDPARLLHAILQASTPGFLPSLFSLCAFHPKKRLPPPLSCTVTMIASNCSLPNPLPLLCPTLGLTVGVSALPQRCAGRV